MGHKVGARNPQSSFDMFFNSIFRTMCYGKSNYHQPHFAGDATEAQII